MGGGDRRDEHRRNPWWSRLHSARCHDGGQSRHRHRGPHIDIGAFEMQQMCVGDCDGDGRVEISELIRLVAITLGKGEERTCAAGDANSDGLLDVAEVLVAVNGALRGCGNR